MFRRLRGMFTGPQGNPLPLPDVPDLGPVNPEWLPEPTYPEPLKTLGDKQELFAKCFARLLLHAEHMGYAVRIGEVERSAHQATRNANTCRVCSRGKTHSNHPAKHAFRPVGISGSLHIQRLAGDIMLFKDGVYLTKSEDYTFLGDFWKALHPLCCWGGDFANRDGGHFSITHRGKR